MSDDDDDDTVEGGSREPLPLFAFSDRLTWPPRLQSRKMYYEHALRNVLYFENELNPQAPKQKLKNAVTLSQ